MRLREPEKFRGQIHRAGYTQAELARAVKVTRQFIGDLADEKTGASQDIAERIEHALGKPRGSLFVPTEWGTRTYPVSVRLNEEEHEAVIAHARKRGKSISAVLVEGIRKLVGLS